MRMSNYYINGTAKDHDWVVKNREMLESYCRDEMRKTGFIPALDIPATFTWDYNYEDGLCHYKIALKGLRVGRKKSKNSLGYMSKEGIVVGKDVEQVEVIV